MKADEKRKLNEASIEELNKQIASLQSELVTAKAHIKLGKEPNVRKAKNIRTQIAVIKTLITQKQEAAGAL